MKKWLWILVVLAFVAFVGTKYVMKTAQNRAVSQQAGSGRAQWGAAVPVVKTEAVQRGQITQTIDMVGSIKPETEVAIQPMISGRLISFNIIEGQFVKAGAVIGEIDGETIRIQNQQALANLAQIKASVQQAEINLSKLKLERERYQELLKKKFVSQSAYDAVEASYQSAMAALEGVQAQQASAEKNYELLQIQMRHTRIMAPSSGYVLKTYTTPGANLTTGTTVATIVPLNRVKLVFQLDQTQAAELREGMTVNFQPDEAAGGRVFRGIIETVAPTYDAATRSLEFSAILNNSDKALLPGMFGRVDAVMASKNNALLIPEESLVQDANRGQGVYRVGTDHIARFQPLIIGLRSKGRAEVISGLSENDQVVAVGQNRLRDGQEVQLLGTERNNKGREGSGGGRPGNRDGKPQTNGDRPQDGGNRSQGGDGRPSGNDGRRGGDRS